MEQLYSAKNKEFSNDKGYYVFAAHLGPIDPITQEPVDESTANSLPDNLFVNVEDAIEFTKYLWSLAEPGY